MRAGRLRHRLTFEEATESRDSFGDLQKSWSDFVTVWGAAEPLRGREFFDARRENVEAEIRFRIRHRDDIDEKMRVVWDGRTYDIESLLDVDGRGRELHVMATETV